MRINKYRIRAIGSNHFITTDFNLLLIKPESKTECHRHGAYSHYMDRTYGSHDSFKFFFKINGLKSVVTILAEAMPLIPQITEFAYK